MSRSYNKLWHILIDRNMTKTQLREAANITTNAMANLGKNESVPVETLQIPFQSTIVEPCEALQNGSKNNSSPFFRTDSSVE